VAELVAVLGVPHNPLLFRTMRDPMPGDLAATAGHFDTFARELRRLEVETLVVVGSDHLRKFGHDMSPPFVVGKAPGYATTYENETRHFGLEEWTVPGDEELAGAILGGSVLPTTVDLTLSNEWVLDHAFSVPLLFLRPEWDLPVVPVHTNTNIPPTPHASRFVDLGRHLADAIAAAPSTSRVGLIATGHLATDIGGPAGFLGGGSPDAEFDAMAVGWMAEGDVDGAIAGCTLERLIAAGNVTPQFLNFLTALAAAGGRPADFAEGTPSRFNAAPFFFWDMTR
jgi:protocatechuate 4,5-dioxygenase, beta chain